MCSLVVHDDAYVYAHTANTFLFQGTSKNTKLTSKKLAVAAFLHDLQEHDGSLEDPISNDYSDSDLSDISTRIENNFDIPDSECTCWICRHCDDVRVGDTECEINHVQ